MRRWRQSRCFSEDDDAEEEGWRKQQQLSALQISLKWLRWALSSLPMFSLCHRGVFPILAFTAHIATNAHRARIATFSSLSVRNTLRGEETVGSGVFWLGLQRFCLRVWFDVKWRLDGGGGGGGCWSCHGLLSFLPSSASHITWRLTASNHHKPTKISRSCHVTSAQVCVSVNL